MRTLLTFFKARIKGYTKKDGTYVRPHDDVRQGKLTLDFTTNRSHDGDMTTDQRQSQRSASPTGLALHYSGEEMSMPTPTMSLHRTMRGGRPAIELVICNATAELRTLLDTLGILPVADMANRRSIMCATPAELDAARDPLRAMFNDQGNWVNK